VRVELLFPSKYLKEADLEGRRVRLVVDKVQVDELQMAGGLKSKKPVVYFRNPKTDEPIEKMLVMNKTNAMAIASVYGPDTDAWIGRPIVLKPAKDRFQGKMVECIRIDLESTEKASKAVAAPAEEPTKQAAREPGEEG